jgi:hypothetical protein
LSGRPDPEFPVGKSGIGKVLPGDIVEGLGALAGAHAVDLYDHETQFR